MNRYLKTDVLFFVTGIIFSVLVLFTVSYTTDIIIHDTIYVINESHFAALFISLFLPFAFIYFIFRKVNRPLGKTLGIAHYLLTLLPLVIIIVLFLLYVRMPEPPHFDYRNKIIIEVDTWCMNNSAMLMGINTLLFVTGQAVLFFNISFTLLKKTSR